MTARKYLAFFFLFSIAFTSSAFTTPGRAIRICDDVSEPPSLNPYHIFTEKAHTIVQQVLEGLVRFGPNGEIQPALATKWKRLSPTTVRFFLRPKVTFHNGEPFNANAVKFSIERYIDPAVGSPTAGFLGSIDRVEVINAKTIDIHTRFPDALLLNRLAAWVFICPTKTFNRYGDKKFGRAPIGTGPFRFSSWKKGKEIRLTANEKYWKPFFPKTPSLVFKFIPADKQISSLLEGEIDVLTSLLGTRTLDVQRHKNTTVLKKLTFFTVAASFDTQSKILKSRKVRQALNYALDKEALVRYDLMGNGRPVRSLSLDDYPTIPNIEGLEPYTYDLDKAKALLKEAGYEKGFRLRMLEVKAKRAAKIIMAHWKRIGVEVDLVSTTDAEIMEVVKKGPWDVVLGSCPDPMHHPFFIHSIFLYSKSPFSQTKSPELDGLIEKVVQEIEPQAHQRAVERLSHYVNENALSLFTYQRIKTYGVRNGISFEPSASGMTHFKDAQFLARGKK